MKKLFAGLLAIAALAGGGWIATDRAGFDRAEWLSDYQQLKTAVEQQYANLQWSRSSKNVDLVALNETALQQLRSAGSKSDARRALETFVAGFNDGHFHIERDPPRLVAKVMSWFNRSPNASIDFAMSAADVCGALGFGEKGHTLAVEDAAPMRSTTFAAGLLTTNSGRKIGVVRIPLFRQREYRSVCENSWPQFQDGKTGICDERCQGRFGVHVKHELAQALADDARALVAMGAASIVIDLTGNGGGTEWAEYAAAALSAKPLRPPAVWLIRAISDSAAVTCDLSQLWQNRNAQPPCWNAVPSPREPEEVQSYARPYTGPLYIMTDANTASASEQFAATLRDNNAALTIGTRTMGIGCGFVDGGNPVRLRYSRLVVWMPNCARFRADGTNEFEGVKPDFPVDWGSDEKSRTEALLEFFDAIPRS